MAAVHQRVLAEDVLDRASERLGAVDHEQDRLLGIEAAVDEVGQQRPRERGVFGRAFPEPERDLDPVARDPERDDVRAIGDLQPVEHQHRQAHVVQPAPHQLAQPAARALDEHLGDRALPGRRRRLLDLAADRLADLGELARRDAREHPAHHRPRQRVTVGELLVTLNRQLALAVGRAHPRTADRDPPAAQGHRPVLVAVTDRDAIAVVLALRAHDLVDLELHQRASKPSLAAPTSSPSASWIRGGSGLSDARRVVTTWLASSFFTAVPPVSMDFRHPSRSQQDRTRREDRRSKFYEISDNLASGLEPQRRAHLD